MFLNCINKPSVYNEYDKIHLSAREICFIHMETVHTITIWLKIHIFHDIFHIFPLWFINRKCEFFSLCTNQLMCLKLQLYWNSIKNYNCFKCRFKNLE